MIPIFNAPATAIGPMLYASITILATEKVLLGERRFGSAERILSTTSDPVDANIGKLLIVAIVSDQVCKL